MSAIDTYTKYNLHSAAPYIGWNVLVCKKGGGTFEGKRPGEVSGGGNALHPTEMPFAMYLNSVGVFCTQQKNLCSLISFELKFHPICWQRGTFSYCIY